MSGKAQSLRFEIVHHGEPAAGLTPWHESVEISFANGGWDEAEAQEYFRSVLEEWSDGGRVMTKAEAKKIEDGL